MITGASGNIGTALLRLLRDTPEITSIGAVATHQPTPAAPYDAAD